MRRLPLRRFPQELIRRREGPTTYNFYGEAVPGAVVTAVLPASIQPISLEDQNFVGGSMLRERVRVFVPTGIQRVVGTGDALTWAGDDLLWNGSPLQWGGTTGYVGADENPLAAAFEDTGADAVEIGTVTYVVEESQLWAGSHCRAVLLRET